MSRNHYGRSKMGSVRGGAWDQDKVGLHDMDVFVAFRQRYEEGKDWPETAFYERVVGDIRNGRSRWECRTEQEFAERLRGIDALFEDIRVNGYRTQAELKPTSLWDEVAVCIDRNGRIMFVNGRHRLAIAKVLDLESIPAVVSVRHREWYEFTRQIRSVIKQMGGVSYSPILHPDLQDVPFQHGPGRFDLISSNLPVRSGRLLDIGAQWGYFSHRFEECGFECVASELSEKSAFFLRKLRDAAGRKFQVRTGSVFDLPTDEEFQVVLGLNVFHHALKEEESYNQLREFLQRLKLKCMVFEPHQPDEPQMRGAYRNFSPKEFLSFIIENTTLAGSRLLGHAEDGRPVYLLR